MKSARYRSAIYPQKSSAAVAEAAAIKSTLVKRTIPIAFGRNAVIKPHKLSRKRSGIVAGMLPVGYVWSSTALPTVRAGEPGIDMKGNRLLKLIPPG